MSRSGQEGDGRNRRWRTAPPRVAEALFRLSLPSRYRDQQLGDLREAYCEIAGREGVATAKRWYRRQVLKSIVPNLASVVRGFRKSTLRRPAGVAVLAGALTQDLSFTLRSVKRRPAFFSVVLLVFALGVGANTIMFSVVNSVLLRPLPYYEPDRLVIPWQTHPHWISGPNPVLRAAGHRFSVSYPVYEDWLEQNTVFENFGVHAYASYITGTGDQTERVIGTRATHGVFAALGVPPLLGRTFVAADDRAGGPRLVVLGHGIWQRRFGSDSSVVGETMILNEEPFTIVGVMPNGFYFPAGRDLWTTFSDEDRQRHRNSNFARPIARLRSNVTLDRAQGEMEILAEHLKEIHPIEGRDYGVNVVYLNADVVRGVRSAMLLLLGTVGIFLFIACANIANLLLVRASERRNEFAVRLSLGAGRGRVLGQLVTEGLVLSVIGGSLGALVAVVCIDPFVAMLPSNTPRLDEVGVDLRVLGFTAALTVLTGVCVGAMPALGTLRTRLATVHQETNRRSSGSRQSNRLQTCLLVSEIALTFVLLVGAGLCLKSLGRLLVAERGFDSDAMVTLRIDTRGSRYGSEERLRSAYEDLYERIHAIPGVTSVAAADFGPLVEGSSYSMMVENPAGHVYTNVQVDWVSGGFFQTFGIPLQEGRVFREDESRDHDRVAIVSETMARTYWPNESAVGKRITFGRTVEANEPWMTVVGVVGDVRHRLDADPHYTVYRPLHYGRPMVAIKTGIDPTMILDPVREAVREVDPSIPVVRLRKFESVISRAVAGPRVRAILLTSLAALAGVLAVVGVFGVLAYTVAQRTKEIGVRMALGADSGSVLLSVLRRGVTHVGMGLALGLAVSLVAVRALEGLLFEVNPADPTTLLSVAALLSATAIAASYLPARRAAMVDPAEALRSE